MNLDSLLSFLLPKPSPVAEAAAAQPSRDAIVRAGKADVTDKPVKPRQERVAEDKSGNPVDVVQVSVQATYMLVAQQFDPKQLSKAEAKELADILFDAGAINRRDRAILENGPADRDIFVDDLVRKRDFIAGFQEQMASGYGESDPQTVNDTSRALTILGRIDAIRERLASG